MRRWRLTTRRRCVEDAAATAIDVLANDTDADGGPKLIASVTDPANGTVVITGGGTGLTYQPDPDYCNAPPGTTPDTFTYTLNGGSTATVSVTVTCVDDAPTAVDDAATVAEDAAATAVNVLANDTDLDGGPKSIARRRDPANGTVVITGGGTGLTYQPDPNYCNTPPGTAPDTFTYTLNGGSTATVSVTVTCVDDPPVAVNDARPCSRTRRRRRSTCSRTTPTSTADRRRSARRRDPANGTVVITGGGTGLTYQPDPNYCNARRADAGHVHLHAQRRLDGDSLDDGHLRAGQSGGRQLGWQHELHGERGGNGDRLGGDGQRSGSGGDDHGRDGADHGRLCRCAGHPGARGLSWSDHGVGQRRHADADR